MAQMDGLPIEGFLLVGRAVEKLKTDAAHHMRSPQQQVMVTLLEALKCWPLTKDELKALESAKSVTQSTENGQEPAYVFEGQRS
jgi:hypothetical protein